MKVVNNKQTSEIQCTHEKKEEEEKINEKPI